VLCNNCGIIESVAQLSSKTLKVCEACKMVFYCSPECQRKDWKIHRLHCDAYVKTKALHETHKEFFDENKGNDSDETEEINGSGKSLAEMGKYYCTIL